MYNTGNGHGSLDSKKTISVIVPFHSNLINFCMPTAPMTTLNTLEKNLYQLIISRLNGESIPVISYQEKISGLVRKGIAGFIIFGGKRDEVRNFIDVIQSISGIPLFIASDIERGAGQQIKESTIFPCQMAMAAAIDRNEPEETAILKDTLRAIADEAKDTGINMPLIPVLDVNRDPDNPIICTRAFSDRPEEVAWFGSEYIKVLESSGLISCAKHFPGHGDTSTDSHIALPVIRKPLEALMKMDLVPFKEAIYKGVSSIMIGHLSIPSVDIKPASLSKKVITHLLREELGYKGLIITDALIMNALKGINNVYSECIKAGADILLHPDNPDEAVEELKSAVGSGEITEEQIEAALHRIMTAKEKISNIERREIDYQRNGILSSQITDMSISLLKNTPGIFPISERNEVQVIFAGDNGLFESSPLKSYFKNVSLVNDTVETENKLLLFSIFTSVAAWKGSSGIEENEKNRIRKLIKKSKKSIVVSFGSPYVLRHFQESDILIAVYEPTNQAQEALMKCLEGRMDFKGRLPVEIGLKIA
jgi:beta-glucosidase-like glycosyl hydrolase